MIHHLTVIDEANIEKAWDSGLDYIWKTMHCSAVKVYLHYWPQPDPKDPTRMKMQANADLKQLMK